MKRGDAAGSANLVVVSRAAALATDWAGYAALRSSQP
jgi:hypothetical protein